MTRAEMVRRFAKGESVAWIAGSARAHAAYCALAKALKVSETEKG